MKKLLFALLFVLLASDTPGQYVARPPSGGTTVLVPQQFITGTDTAATDTAALQAAIDALGVNGGVIQTSGTVSISGSSLTFPALTKPLRFEVYGSWRLATTLILPDKVEWVGTGGAVPLQFQRAGPVAGIIPPSGNIPTVKVTGQNHHLLKNLAIDGNSGIGILYDGASGLGALANLENVAVLPADVNTAYCLVADAWFWLWMRDCSFLARTNNPYAIRLTTSSAAFSQAGLIHLSDSVIAGKGIQLDAQVTVNSQGNLKIKNVVMESGTQAFLTLDGTNGTVSGIDVDHFESADSVSQASIINIVAGPVNTLTVRNSETLLSATTPLISGGSIDDLKIFTSRAVKYSNGWSLGTTQKRFSVIQDGAFDGAWSGRGFAMGPSIIPYASLATIQDVSLWGSQTGSATVTTGITAPDGSTTAAKLTTASGTQSRRVLSLASQSLAVGDWVIVGVWMRSEDATVPASTASVFTASAGSPATWSTGSSTFPITNDASQRLGASWSPVVVAEKVATSPSGSYTFILDLKCDATHPTSYWMPFVIKVPAAAGDEEALRITRYITNVRASMAAGTLAGFPHEPVVMGGTVDMAGSSGTNRLYIYGPDSGSNQTNSARYYSYKNTTDADYLDVGSNGSGDFNIQSASSRGASNNININANGGKISIRTNGTQRWEFSQSAGNFVPVTDNNVTLGDSTHGVKLLYKSNTLTATGTTGAQTINKACGTVNFAASATSLVVTNNLVTSTTVIRAFPVGAFDATATAFTCTAGSGSFTITSNAAATAETKVGFEIVIP